MLLWLRAGTAAAGSARLMASASAATSTSYAALPLPRTSTHYRSQHNCFLNTVDPRCDLSYNGLVFLQVHEGQPEAARSINGPGQPKVPKFCTVVTDDNYHGRLLPPYFQRVCTVTAVLFLVPWSAWDLPRQAVVAVHNAIELDDTACAQIGVCAEESRLLCAASA